MSDNSTLNQPTTSGDVYRSVQKGTPKSQVVVLDLGGSGTENLSGIDLGSGVAGGGTFRIVLASNVALPAGTNNIGDVDVLTVPADPFGVNADAASATGSISAKLRFIASTGIPITGSVVVTNAGVFAVQAAQSGTWNITNISGTISLPTGAATAANQTSELALLTTINTSVGLLDNVVGEFGQAILPAYGLALGGSDGTTFQECKVVAPADNLASSRGLVTVAINMVWDGSAYDRVPGNSADGMLVNLGTNNDVTLNAGSAIIGNVRIDQTTPGTTNGVQVNAALPAGNNNIGDVDAVQSGTWNIATVTTVTAVTSITNTVTVGGNVAHDAADSGNPQKIGAKATASISGATMVAAADRTDLFAGIDGVQITRPHCNLEDIVTGNATNTDGTLTQCIAAQAAGIKTYLTSIIIANSSSSNITVDIKDGSTTKVTIPVPANGGAIFNPPVPLPGTAATAWNFDPSAAATTITCSMIGFKSKV